MLALNELNDSFVHRVAGNTDGPRVDDPAHAYNCDIGGAASNIDDNVSARLGDRKSGADGSRHGFFDQKDLRCFSAVRRVLDSSALHLRNTGGNADNDARTHKTPSVLRLPDEVLKHLLGDFEIRDHTVLHRADGHNIDRCATEHLLCVSADGLDAIVYLIYSDDRGFIDHDTSPLSVHERVRGSEINGQIAGTERHKRTSLTTWA